CYDAHGAVHLPERVRVSDPIRNGDRWWSAAVRGRLHTDDHQLADQPKERSSMSETRALVAAGPRRTWTSIDGRSVKGSDALRVVVLVAGALASLVPLVWMFLGSFKSPTELASRPPTFLPESWGLDNYTEALSKFNFVQYLSNS